MENNIHKSQNDNFYEWLERENKTFRYLEGDY